MKQFKFSTALFAVFLCTRLMAATQNESLLDDFESEPKNWKYIGGEEFPGAKGAFTRDTSVAHSGKNSYRLRADFTGGGAYVGVWRELAGLNIGDIQELRFWVKASQVSQLGIRINDSTGQCHQKKGVPLATGEAWQEVVLKVSELTGGEHWGGANDGHWHGPAAGFGVNIGTDSVGADKQGSIWIDDVRVVTLPPGKPTLLSGVLSQPAGRPGYGLKLTYRWQAEPMGGDYKPFVHIRGPSGKTEFQDDHDLPVSTARWSGSVEYERTLVFPMNLPVGEYKVVAGLWNPKGGARLPIKPGEGVKETESNGYQIGTFQVADDAPIPALGKVTLNLDGYHVTFDEDFKEQELSVSARGPGTRWIAHTPYGGDFGDAAFTNPGKDFPFTIQNGVLRIEARKVDGKWRSGLISSVDPKGNGFSQKFGYFEMRAKLPKGLGTWPAFWLMGVPNLKDKSMTGIELDVLEQYGVNAHALHSTVHWWYPGGKHAAEGKPFIVEGMTDDFHRYGVMVKADFTIFYFDGVELWRLKTPEESKVPLYLMVDLALGGGWPIDKTPNPSYMEVDYVRAYAK